MDHGGRRYLAKNGVMDVPDHVGRDLLKDGCFLPADKPAAAEGFICSNCGFHGYFRTCGRCGGICERPQRKEAHGSQEAS